MTMLERIARGICKASGDDWGREGPDGLMPAYGPIARAAVEAMGTPSEAMIAAYVEAARRPHTATSGNGITLCYQAMLRAILDETSETMKENSNGNV